MKEMVYGGVREQEVIYSGEYKGFDIAIVNRKETRNDRNWHITRH